MPQRKIPWLQPCGAKRSNGLVCKQYAMYGGLRCRNHGGASPQAKKKARERVEVASRAAIKPAIDALVERLTTGPRHKRLKVALAVLTESGLLSQEVADSIDPMSEGDLVFEENNVPEE